MLSISYPQVESLLKDILKSMEEKEIRKRVFLQECRYNLAVLSILDWKSDHKEMSKYILPKLKTEISQIMLMHFKNDILNLSVEQLKQIFASSKQNEDPDPNDLLTEIINKILLLKVIADMPEKLQKEDKSNLYQRITNLRNSLLSIIKFIDR